MGKSTRNILLLITRQQNGCNMIHHLQERLRRSIRSLINMPLSARTLAFLAARAAAQMHHIERANFALERPGECSARYSLWKKGQGKYRTRTPSRVIGISIGTGLIPGPSTFVVKT